jgi:hypothetical protein
LRTVVRPTKPPGRVFLRGFCNRWVLAWDIQINCERYIREAKIIGVSKISDRFTSFVSLLVKLAIDTISSRPE